MTKEEQGVAVMKRAYLISLELEDLTPQLRGTTLLAAAVMATWRTGKLQGNIPPHPMQAVLDTLSSEIAELGRDTMAFRYAQIALEKYLPELTKQIVLSQKYWETA